VKNSLISRRFGLWFFPLLLVGVVALFPLAAHSAATMVIVNGDAPGVGLNDPTPVAPVGGNSGTTLGEQRMNALQHAADIWGSHLTSVVPIRINAYFHPYICTATSAEFGFAGPGYYYYNFVGAILPDTWYPKALANKLHGSDLDPNVEDIDAYFNSNLGQTGCLTGTHFYLGLDNNHGSDIDLVTQALHEFARGLGFFTGTNLSGGYTWGGYPFVYEHFILDLTTNKRWVEMTNSERAASAINTRKVVWTGANVTASVPSVLSFGTPQLLISAPPSVGDSGAYMVGTASFGPLLPSNPRNTTGQLMPIVGLACGPLSGANALAANGNIVLIDRGTCTFVEKVKNAQNAGAIGVIIGDNVAGSPPAGLGGADPTIVISSVRITQADANTLKNALKYRSRTHSGVFANLGVNLAVRPGADALNRMLLYTPNPIVISNSVNSWDTSAFPSLLMEPSIASDLTHSVDVPQDLTLPLLKDLCW
jgi:hypothetical protein